MTPVEIGSAVCAGIIGSFLAWREWKEKRAQKRGLRANPARCEDHERRLRFIEDLSSRYDERIRVLQNTVSRIEESTDAILIAIGKRYGRLK